MFLKIRSLFQSTYLQSEQESKDYIRGNTKPDTKIMVLMITVAFSVVMVRYFGDTLYLLSFLYWTGATSLYLFLGNLFLKSSSAGFYSLLWWVSLVIFFYFLVPVLIVKLWWKERLRDYGFRLNGAFKDYWLYLLMLVVMLPLVLYFSKSQAFLDRYPFYKPSATESLFPKFLIWELFYFVHFIAVEFLFRGFMVHGTKRRFGFYSVFVMMLPYCMVHFGKPFPETMAAILAGLVLGMVSLKSKSILLGVAIHYTVAITMDLCALWHLRG